MLGRAGSLSCGTCTRRDCSPRVCRRLRTLFTILDRSFLVTLTAQCPEARYAELGPTYKEVLDSFKFK